MTYDLRLINADGSPGEFLPDYSDLKFSPTFSDIGSIEFDYAMMGTNASPLYVEDAEVAVFLNGTELDDCRFIISDDDGDELDEAGFKFHFVGRTWGWVMLDDAIVYPNSGSTTLADQTSFANATVGTIIRTHIQRAQARGVMSNVDMSSFSNTNDSNGSAWGQTISIAYDTGVGVNQVIQNLVEQGLVEIKWVGRSLRVYKPGTLGADKTVLAEPIVFHRNRDIKEVPRKRTTRELANVVLIQGDNNVLKERSDIASLGARRRREMYVSQGGVSDPNTLDIIAATQLSLRAVPRLQKTPGINQTPVGVGPQPFSDYGPGDWVFLEEANGVLTKYRLRQLTINLKADDATPDVSAVLNDLIAEQEIRNARKIAGITGGATLAGGSSALPTDPAATDTMPPAQVTGVTLSTSTYTTQDGRQLAYIGVSWVAVTTNQDTTAIGDLDHYEVQFQATGVGSTWSPSGNVTGTSAVISALPVGKGYSVRVRTVDTNGNGGAWSATSSTTTAADSTPPNQPSTPTIDNTSFLGTLRVTWDGKDNTAGPMPGDWDRTEVHASTTSGFTPSASTLVDAILTSSGGVSSFSASVSVPTFVKLVAVDTSGNRSTPSTQVSATARQAVNADLLTDAIDNRLLADNAVAQANIQDLAVGTAEMIDLAVVNAKIANLAVDDAKIASMSVGKLTVGTLTADATLSARIKTADYGARVELNANGLKAYTAFTATLASAITTTSQTAITVNTPVGTLPPLPHTIQIDSEQMSVTARSGNNWTITRAANGTTAATHSSGANIIDRSGTLSVDIASTGAASFIGSINAGSIITGALFRTASTGQRMEIAPGVNTNRINFYSGFAGESAAGYIEVDTDFVSGGFINIVTPTASGKKITLSLRGGVGGLGGTQSRVSITTEEFLMQDGSGPYVSYQLGGPSGLESGMFRAANGASLVSQNIKYFWATDSAFHELSRGRVPGTYGVLTATGTNTSNSGTFIQPDSDLNTDVITLDPARAYCFRTGMVLQSTVAGDRPGIQFYRVTDGVSIKSFVMPAIAGVNSDNYFQCEVIINGNNVSGYYSIRIARLGGTGVISARSGSWFYIEDIGEAE